MAVLQEIKVPLISVNDTSLTVIDVLFENGNTVKSGDIILVFETSKTTYDVIANSDGFIQYFCDVDKDYNVNDIVAKIVSTEAEVEKKISQKKSSIPVSEKNIFLPINAIGTWEGDTLFSHDAIKLIESKGIGIEKFKGFDFVNKNDVENFIGLENKQSAKVNSKPVSQRINKELPTDATKVIVEKLSSNKKKEIEYLSEVQSTGLTSTINIFVETEGIFTHINKSLQVLKNSLLPVIIYETARLLEKYRELNAYFTGNAVAYYKEVNVGFAIDIDKGLKVLKIADTSQKTMKLIEEDIMLLSNKYIDDSLQIDDLIDVTFTITDLSSESVSFFKPLVNMMNSAILGVSSIDEKLNRCALSITFDHRVTEGKRVARFLKELKERLESYQSSFHPSSNQNLRCFKCYKTLGEDLSDVGFAKCITPEGKEAYICQSCLKGF